jgi:hypothetical protein
MVEFQVVVIKRNGQRADGFWPWHQHGTGIFAESEERNPQPSMEKISEKRSPMYLHPPENLIHFFFAAFTNDLCHFPKE